MTTKARAAPAGPEPPTRRSAPAPPASGSPAPALGLPREDQAHRLGTGGGVAELAADDRGGGLRSRLPYAAHRHAHVFALHDDDRAAGTEDLHQRVRYLRGETFLH